MWAQVFSLRGCDELRRFSHSPGLVAPTAAPPRSWPIYFFFKCQEPFVESWVTWQCHSVNRRAAGQVTVIFATPGHNHPVSDPSCSDRPQPRWVTLVENTTPHNAVEGDLDALLRKGTVVFQRYIDWLAVFAQLGVLHLGRPMSIGDTRFEARHRGTSRQSGYNDEQGGA